MFSIINDPKINIFLSFLFFIFFGNPGWWCILFPIQKHKSLALFSLSDCFEEGVSSALKKLWSSIH